MIAIVAILAVTSSALALNSVDTSVTARVGTVTLFLGPAGQKPIPVNATATLTLHVEGDPVFVKASAVPCPTGQVGATARVTTNGAPATATVTVTKEGSVVATKTVSIDPVDTQLVGVCAEVSAP